MKKYNYIDFKSEMKEKEEKNKRRIRWMLEKAKERDHEKLKQQKVEEFERK